MKLDSTRSLKQEIGQDVASARVEAVLDEVEPAPIVEVALGVAAGTQPNDFRLAVRIPPGPQAEEVAAEISDRAAGEVDVRVIRVEARHIPQPQAGVPPWLNAVRLPLEPGVAIAPKGYNWVGTLFGFGRRTSGALVGISNAHVLGGLDGVPVGTPVLQPYGGEPIGVTAQHVPLRTSGNLVDIQCFDLRAVPIAARYALSIGQVRGLVEVSPDDLRREAGKQGRTTGVRFGLCTAIEVDNLPIGYGAAGVLRFDDQLEFSGGPASVFSAGGDSGSMICWRGGDVPAILFAGGDSGGEDFTYGCRAVSGLNLLGLTLV
jgi:hypothetical protein